MASFEQLIEDGIITAEEQADAEAALACFDTLFGVDQGLDEAILAAFMDSSLLDAIAACLQDQLKQAVIDCITGPQSPLTKELLGSIIQGLVDEETGGPELPAVDENAEEGVDYVLTSSSIKVLTFTGSTKKVAIGEPIKLEEV